MNRRILSKLLNGFLFVIFGTSIIAVVVDKSTSTVLAKPQDHRLVAESNQSCLYAAQQNNQLPNSNTPLDVIVFIDETDSALTIDPALPTNNNIPFRYRLLHVLANFLLLDGELRLRNEYNHLSVFVYAGETVQIQERKPVNTNTIAEFESHKGFNLNSRSYVDFNKLLMAIRTNIQVADDGLPVVLLINDPFPNGADAPGEDFATTAYSQWQSFSTEYEKKSFYLLDFSVRTLNSSNEREAGRAKWREEFFSKAGINGHLLSVTEYNQLTTIARIIEEVVGQPLFYLVSANSSEIHISPLADRVDFGLMFNQMPSDNAHWTPSTATDVGNIRASLENQISNGLLYKAENPRQIWNLPENNIDREVLFTYQVVGGLESFIVTANPPTSEGQYLTVQAQFAPNSLVDPEVSVSVPDDSIEIPDVSVRKNLGGDTFAWHIGPINHISQSAGIEISLESGEKPPFICTFTVLPVPELIIEPSFKIPENEEPLDLDIIVVNDDRLVDSSSSLPSVFITQADESVEGIQLYAKTVFNGTVSNTATYSATIESIETIDSQLSWTIIAELNTETKEGFPIALQDKVTILPSVTKVDPPPTPEVEVVEVVVEVVKVPGEALVFLTMGTLILAFIVFGLTRPSDPDPEALGDEEE